MREFEVEGKTARLNERDYSQLLKRFDTTRASKGVLSYKILVRCICHWYSKCYECPFSSAHPRVRLISVSCIEVLKSLNLLPDHATLFNRSHVVWTKDNHKMAVTELDKIHDALLSLERRPRSERV